jgi:hypothetical protein
LSGTGFGGCFLHGNGNADRDDLRGSGSEDGYFRVPGETHDLVRKESGGFASRVLRGEEGGSDEKRPENQGWPPGITKCIGFTGRVLTRTS